MTISISVSVNGNYKVPVTVEHSDGTTNTETISGRGLDHPYVKHIPFYHGVDSVVRVTVGPEEVDDGDA